MSAGAHKFIAAFAVAIVTIAIGACAGSQNPAIPEGPGEIQATFTVPGDVDPNRHLIGLWRWDLDAASSEPVRDRTVADHINIADALLMPEYAAALEVTFDPFLSAGAFAPPAVRITATLHNMFDITGWNVRGIVIDDSGLMEVTDPDGCTAQWDMGSNIPLNAYINFSTPGGNFPHGEEITREYVIESPTGELPSEIWFAVDAGTEGLIQSATEFPLAAVNGVLRYPGDQVPILCRIKDPQAVVDWVAAGTKMFTGGATYLTDQGYVGDYREYTGMLNYSGGLGSGVFPVHFAAHSPLDIPTCASAVVRVDPGPFASGPADSGCSQRCYDPARTCRTTAPIVCPVNDFVVRPPASSSGLILTEEIKVIRRLEADCSIALQSALAESPLWTRLIGDSELATAPALGNDGTIFFLEPEQGRLRALYQDGTDRWTHQFTCRTHTDLILTSSPIGGLLITALREDGKDIAIVGVGTDGHLRWRYEIATQPAGPAEVPRLALGPGGTLYYTYPTGGVLALDLLGNPLWSKAQSGWHSAQDPVVGDDDRLFFIANDGQLVVCLSQSGSLKWSYPMQSDRFAAFPSLSYQGHLFIAIEVAGDYVAYRELDGETGMLVQAVQAIGLRGYIVHGTHHDCVYIQREDPSEQYVCCDDYFTCRDSNGVLNWFLHTPGVTQIGAYPVVSPNNDIFVQGPDGMYVVI